MAKKKKQEFVLNRFYKFIVALVAIVCLGMMFIPSVGIVGKISGTEVSSVNGWQAIFGTDDTSVTGGVFNLGFSFPALLIVIFLLAGGVIPLILKGQLGTFISMGCFVAAAVLSFLLATLVIPSDATKLIFKMSLKVGAILVGIFSIIGAGLGAVKLIVK